MCLNDIFVKLYCAQQGNAKSSNAAGMTDQQSVLSSGQDGPTAGGSSGGDDGDKPPSSPVASHCVDEMAPAEEDEEEEDVMAPDNITSTPSSAPHCAPSKGRSPVHRQIRHQRNARRILDSWMADDDPGQPRSDCKHIFN